MEKETSKTEFPPKERIISAVLGIVLLLICAVLAGIWIKDELNYRKIYEQTAENALGYIQNKYGFEAKIINAPDKNSYEWSENSSFIRLIMKYGEKEFTVQADKYKGGAECVDSYQTDEIRAAAEEYLSELFPDGTIVQFDYSDIRSNYLNTARDYFDGGNIEGILENSDGYIEMVFAGRELSEEDIGKLPKNFNAELTSFTDEKRRYEFLSRESSGYKYGNYTLFAPYISSHIGRENNEINASRIEFTAFDEFMYAHIAEYYEFPRSDNRAEFEYAEYGEINEAFRRGEEEQWLSKPLSEEYYLKFIPNGVQIYYPLDKLGGYDLENISLAMFDHGGGIYCRDMLRGEICGEYAVFRIRPGDDCYFMFVDTSGLGEYPPVSENE